MSKDFLKHLSKVSVLTLLFIVFAFPFSGNTAKQIKEFYSKTPDFLRPALNLRNEYSDIAEMKEVDNLMSDLMDRWKIAGASVAIAKEGRLVYAKGFGVADKESAMPVMPNHLFRIASVSKLITAVAIMKLEEEGLLSLDDIVFGENGILNDSIYTHALDEDIYKINIENLLYHQGGWSSRGRDFMFDPVNIAEKMNVTPPANAATIIQYALTKRLRYQPGTAYEYSNLGYCILGEVIEKLSGETYEMYVNENILHPLGIYSMQLGENLFINKAPDEVTYYDYEGSSQRPSCYGTGELVPKTYGGTNIEALGAAGGWIGTPSQLMQLVTAIDGFESRPDILSEKSISQMTTPTSINDCGMGWMGIKEDFWYRTGTLAGTSALLVRQNDEISYMVVVNTSTWTGPRFTNEIKRSMDKALREIDEWPSHDLFERTEFEVSSTTDIF